MPLPNNLRLTRLLLLLLLLVLAYSVESAVGTSASLDSFLMSQHTAGEAALYRQCFQRTVARLKEICGLMNDTKYAEIALDLLNCQLALIQLPQIRCRSLDTCGAFRELADTPTLLATYTRFYVHAVTTCAFDELQNEQRRMLEVVASILRAVDGLPADLRVVAGAADEVQRHQARLVQLQSVTLQKQTEIMRVVAESDQVVRLHDAIDETRLFLVSTYYSIQLSIEAVILVALVVLFTYPAELRQCRAHLTGLYIVKLFVEKQIVHSVLLRTYATEEAMDAGLHQTLMITRSVATIATLAVLYATPTGEGRKVTVDDLQASVDQLELDIEEWIMVNRLGLLRRHDD